jgi:hypothetical protein
MRMEVFLEIEKKKGFYLRIVRSIISGYFLISVEAYQF